MRALNPSAGTRKFALDNVIIHASDGMAILVLAKI
jgi:hypothetical protein